MKVEQKKDSIDVLFKLVNYSNTDQILQFNRKKFVSYAILKGKGHS